MPHLTLESARYGDLPLNQVLYTDKGVEALSGVTGLGLPPVAVQWRESASHGASYRGHRLLTRPIDIPLYVGTDNRESLQAALRKLALITSDEVTIRWVEDDGSSWYTKGIRTGGGDYVYGVDTTGQDDLLTVLTFTAGDPYWTSSRKIVGRITNRTEVAGPGASTAKRGLLGGGSLRHMWLSSTRTIGKMEFENDGDADAYPIWTIQGPGLNFRAVAPTGERFDWDGQIFGNERITINARTGEVVDQNGASQYHRLKPAPKFWRVPPGKSEATVAMDNPIASGRGRTGRTRVNHVTNPSFETNTNGTQPVNCTVARDTSRFVSGNGIPSTASLRVTATPGTIASNGVPFVQVVVSGLEPGKSYYISAWSLPGAGSLAPSALQVAATGNTAVTHYRPEGASGWYEHNATQRAAADGTMRVLLASTLVGGLTYPANYYTYWDRLYVGDVGTYFDGSTPNTSAAEHEWAGTAHGSKSTRFEVGEILGSSIECEYRARRHLVI